MSEQNSPKHRLRSILTHTALSSKHSFIEDLNVSTASKRSLKTKTIRELISEVKNHRNINIDAGLDMSAYTRVTNSLGKTYAESKRDDGLNPLGYKSVKDYLMMHRRLEGSLREHLTEVLTDLEIETIKIYNTIRLKQGVKLEDFYKQIYSMNFLSKLLHNSFPKHNVYEKELILFNDKNLPIASVSLEGSDSSEFELLAYLPTGLEATSMFLDLLSEYFEASSPEGQIVKITGIGPTGIQTKVETISLDKVQTSPAAFYPWMNGVSTQDYIAEYLTSSANVLLFMGPPGTGKSSLIRTAVAKLGLKVLFCSSMSVASDPSFVSKLGEMISAPDSDFDAIIIEDADVLIRPRDQGNMALSEILNATSGMTSQGGYKLIVTTNQTNTDNIDSALLRPGRCFDVMEFGTLSHNEANAARESIGLAKLNFTGVERTLAEALSAHELVTEKSSFENESRIVAPRFPLKKRL